MKNNNHKKAKKAKTSNVLGIGMFLGVLFGVAIDNVGLGLLLGLCIATAYEAELVKKTKSERKDDE